MVNDPTAVRVVSTRRDFGLWRGHRHSINEGYHTPFRFTSELSKATIRLKPAPLTAQDQQKPEDGKAAAAVAAE